VPQPEIDRNEVIIMTPMQRVWTASAAAVLVLDTGGALGSRAFGFSYASLSPLSFVIYTAAGFAAGRLGGLKAGVLAGALTGLVEATIGWTISWRIGPGRPEAEIGAQDIALTILIVVLTGALFGLIGGALGRWLRARRQTQT
jgi:hypothetical protein